MSQQPITKPPLLSQTLRRGQVDVIVTYWHFAARLRGEGGWRSAFSMADLHRLLKLTGADPDHLMPASLFYRRRP